MTKISTVFAKKSFDCRLGLDAKRVLDQLTRGDAHGVRLLLYLTLWAAVMAIFFIWLRMVDFWSRIVDVS